MQASGAAECRCWDQCSLERRMRLQRHSIVKAPRYHLVFESDKWPRSVPCGNSGLSVRLQSICMERCVAAGLGVTDDAGQVQKRASRDGCLIYS